MRGVKDFLKESLPGMVDYILVISTPVSEAYGPCPEPSVEKRERLAIVNALRERGTIMPVLDREAVPLLPHLLDVPRHLAVVTSAVIRASKGKQKRKPVEPADAQFDEFIARCFEVEETALHRVSRLASRSSEKNSAFSATNRHSTSPTIGFRPPPCNSMSPSSHRSLVPQNSPRPASQSDFSGMSQGLEMLSDTFLTSSPVSTNVQPPSSQLTRVSQPDLSGQPSSPEDGTWSQRRNKLTGRSTSTDSIPSFIAQSPADSSLTLKAAESQTESDDQMRKKKGLLRGILTRR